MSDTVDNDTVLDNTSDDAADTGNNDSLLNTDDLGENEYLLADGFKAKGETPEWYKADKYKTVADQAKAYTELEKKFGGFKGAPKDGYQAPEGIDSEDALFAQLKEFGEKTNMSQDAFNDAWELLVAQNEASEAANQESELIALGDKAHERIGNVTQFLKNSLDSDTYKQAESMITSAKDVELVELLINATAPKKLPIDGHIEPGGVTWEDIEAEMYKTNEHGQLLRSVDTKHEQKIQRMMKEFGGDKPYSKTIG